MKRLSSNEKYAARKRGGAAVRGMKGSEKTSGTYELDHTSAAADDLYPLPKDLLAIEAHPEPISSPWPARSLVFKVIFFVCGELER